MKNQNKFAGYPASRSLSKFFDCRSVPIPLKPDEDIGRKQGTRTKYKREDPLRLALLGPSPGGLGRGEESDGAVVNKSAGFLTTMSN